MASQETESTSLSLSPSPWSLDGWAGTGVLIGLCVLVFGLYVWTYRKRKHLLESVEQVHESRQRQVRSEIVAFE
jgi:hypothetical protein